MRLLSTEGILACSTVDLFPLPIFRRDRLRVGRPLVRSERGEKMLYSGTDPESNITEYA
jgi:hypothetical protein